MYSILVYVYYKKFTDQAQFLIMPQINFWRFLICLPALKGSATNLKGGGMTLSKD